jgi:hypothetical protein
MPKLWPTTLKRFRAVPALPLLFLLALFGFPAHGAAITAIPTADAFLFAGESAQNYGAAGALAIAGSSQPQGEYQSLMKFDLGPAKAAFDAAYGAGNWTLDSATLRLTTTAPNNVIFNPITAGNFNVTWQQIDAWTEGSGTPALPTADGIAFGGIASLQSAQDAALGTLAFPGGTGVATTYPLALVSGLTADASSGGTLSLRLSVPAGSAASFTFAARSFQTTASRPVLTLTAVPEPSAAGGCAAAAAAFASLSRRRRNASPEHVQIPVVGPEAFLDRR